MAEAKSPMTVAFFGATGDCTGYCLASILASGISCRALARTPSKLTASLKAKGVSPELLDSHLTIIEGNAKDVEAVKQVLQTSDEKGRVVDKIVSGIGGTQIVFTWNPLRPFTLSDPTICQDAGATLLQALQELDPARKPALVNVLTTGIAPSGMPSDLPFPYKILYPWLGHVMHEDKRVLQDRLVEHMRLPESQRAISSFTNVKPSLLFDGEAKGMQATRQGVDETPAVGYWINRADVGAWMAENLVNQDGKQWKNKGVTLTY
ncbi:hypothetical protein LTR56_020387 [Elasticomyces elasticus]|nr:hypothetical protein LTR56_020387 [Elasticomyces elasticus]KAK3633111.1 hypothetical protein LTR22_020309 [Elasticomyces elasticus]KAK4910245.1 hypothetical protein LTR49_021062 [Elasticomyces elasticus]KAK5749998.1 hypothetical protein LTS12_019946 [Elasticomyces elasticus]